MAIERRRPLPVGRYWIDVLEVSKNKWLGWRDAFVPKGDAFVEVTEDIPATSDSAARQFVIFNTKKELVWPDDMGIGVNVAGPEIRSSADTVKGVDLTPSFELPTAQQITAGIERTLIGLAVVVGIAVVGGVVIVAMGNRRGRR